MTSADHIGQTVIDTIADYPVLETVGDLAQLLAALPPQMPLLLDEYTRIAAEYRDQPVTRAVTPRVIPVGEYTGAEPVKLMQGLQLGTVLVPETDDVARITSEAQRRGLPPEGDLDRATEALEDSRGTLRDGLEGSVEALELLSALVGDYAAQHVPAGDVQDNLRIEGERINSSAARVRALIDQVVTAAEGPTA